jgi:hypothetical protein
MVIYGDGAFKELICLACTFFFAVDGGAQSDLHFFITLQMSIANTSSQGVLFHVKSQTEEIENNPQLQQKMRFAWGNKHRSPNEFLIGQDGDHLLMPFECDLCIFGKFKSHNPILSNAQDSLLSACIRQMKLDAFWSQAKNMTLANRNKVAI